MPRKKPPPSPPPRAQLASELESHLGYWLRFVSNHVSHAFRAKVEGAGASVSEWVVLRLLYGGQHTAAGAIAEAIGMTKGAVSKVVARLETKRLLERAVLEDDRRQQGLTLTAKGRALVPDLARLADENDAEFFAHLPQHTQAELLALLRELVRHHRLESVPVD
jgi:DNA-binding MarR family transcriptional regulator